MIISSHNNIRSGHSAKEAEAWVGYLLNQTAHRIRLATAATLEPLGLSPPQLRALEVIAAAQPLNQAKLGAMVDMDRSTIVHLVDHLERIGAAVREADPADRRSHAIVLTENGHRILRDGQARGRAVEEAFLAPLSPPERETLRKLLQKLFDPIPCPKEKEREPSTPPSNP